jgi:hypothetical protein
MDYLSRISRCLKNPKLEWLYQNIWNVGIPKNVPIFRHRTYK